MTASEKNSGGRETGPDEETTGLPGLRTWRAVYCVVLGSFLLWVALLFALSWIYR